MRNNIQHQRFELEIDGQIVFADYRLEGKTLIIAHVEAPPVLRGTGAAGKLMEAIMRYVREEQYKITPLCSYAAAWMQRHEDTCDLLSVK